MAPMKHESMSSQLGVCCFLFCLGRWMRLRNGGSSWPEVDDCECDGCNCEDHWEGTRFSRPFSCSWSRTHLVMLASVACLSSHSLMAASMALLRSPFFPPKTVTTANRCLRSVSSEITMYNLPKVYIAGRYVQH
jgi:hypothetical protein